MKIQQLLAVSWLLGFGLAAGNAAAHGRWISPSHTILSGEKSDAVTFDLSISNQIFHPDYAIGGDIVDDNFKPPFSDDNPRGKILKTLVDSTRLAVQLPDKTVDTSAKLINFKRKSTAAFMLTQSGTYRIQVQQNPIYFTWYKSADGQLHREFGQPTQTRSFIPKDATDVRGSVLYPRIETFVTRNQLTYDVLAPRGEGLELAFTTHPNELFAAETATFTLLLNGKPVAAGTPVHITRNDTRYRNARDTLDLLTKKDGKLSITWPTAGLYLLEVEVETEVDEKEFQQAVYSLYTTLEVNPE